MASYVKLNSSNTLGIAVWFEGPRNYLLRNIQENIGKG